ncbi:MAG: MopE-related protein [Myxococcota bacterium]
MIVLVPVWIGVATRAGAAESCDGRDDDGDGAVAEGPVYAAIDADGDGFGDAIGAALFADCGELPAGYAPPTDCDDADGAVHPGATEGCDGRDDDCDGVFDDGACDGDVFTYDEQAWLVVEKEIDWFSADDACRSIDWALATPSDQSQHKGLYDAIWGHDEGPYWIGYTDAALEGDWWWIDGAMPGFAPWAPGEPDDDDPDGQDCAVFDLDGTFYDRTCSWTYPYACERPCAAHDWFWDGDGDGLGDPSDRWWGCEPPDGVVANPLDCDDRDPSQPVVRYADDDNDGYGGVGAIGCGDAGPTGVGGDCDDADGAVSPGAPEVADDGIDQDCDGADLRSDDPDPTTTATAPDDGSGDADHDGVIDRRDPAPDDPGGAVAVAPTAPGCAVGGSGPIAAGLVAAAAVVGRRRATRQGRRNTVVRA